MEPTEFICTYDGCNCGKAFPHQKALSGHLGGKTEVMTPIRHGTRRGYQREVRAGGVICQPCKAANAKWMRGYRARARADKRNENR